MKTSPLSYLPFIKQIPRLSGLRKITRSIKVQFISNHEILFAQHLSSYEKSKFFPVDQNKKIVACGTHMLLNSPEYNIMNLKLTTIGCLKYSSRAGSLKLDKLTP